MLINVNKILVSVHMPHITRQMPHITHASYIIHMPHITRQMNNTESACPKTIGRRKFNKPKISKKSRGSTKNYTSRKVIFIMTSHFVMEFEFFWISLVITMITRNLVSIILPNRFQCPYSSENNSTSLRASPAREFVSALLFTQPPHAKICWQSLKQNAVRFVRSLSIGQS